MPGANSIGWRTWHLARVQGSELCQVFDWGEDAAVDGCMRFEPVFYAAHDIDRLGRIEPYQGLIRACLGVTSSGAFWWIPRSSGRFSICCLEFAPLHTGVRSPSSCIWFTCGVGWSPVDVPQQSVPDDHEGGYAWEKQIDSECLAEVCASTGRWLVSALEIRTETLQRRSPLVPSAARGHSPGRSGPAQTLTQ